MIFKLFGIDDDYLNDYMCSVEKRGLGLFQPPPLTGLNPPLSSEWASLPHLQLAHVPLTPRSQDLPAPPSDRGG